MDSFRRSLILTSVCTLVGLKVNSGVNKTNTRSQITLDNSNTLYPGQLYKLPKQPSIGEEVVLAISTNCMIDPPLLKYSNDKILGESEDLVLDSIGIVRLKFQDRQNGWVLV